MARSLRLPVQNVLGMTTVQDSVTAVAGVLGSASDPKRVLPGLYGGSRCEGIKHDGTRCTTILNRYNKTGLCGTCTPRTSRRREVHLIKDDEDD